MTEPDPIDALFSAEGLAEMRAAIIEATGEAPIGTPRELVQRLLVNNIRHCAQKLEPIIDLAVKLGDVMDQGAGHALFTLGQAVESMTIARALLLGRAVGELEHALICGRDPKAHPEVAPTNMPTPTATH